ncbi:hypothetical protein DSO57_1006199 [Entomophthora muscae]|uniref:Uncharacterized protein n=1 Tax=Entomophthora muscae TaxID=34485 RepID=A0ACC2S9W8_9FUNG|nr:hypothetical protein DSO57_1006199 [Entomophthora muscae]
MTIPENSVPGISNPTIFEIKLNATESGWKEFNSPKFNASDIVLATSPKNLNKFAFSADNMTYLFHPEKYSIRVLSGSTPGLRGISLSSNLLVLFGNLPIASENNFLVSYEEGLKVIRLNSGHSQITGYLVGKVLYAFTNSKYNCQVDGFYWKFDTDTGLFAQVERACNENVSHLSSTLIKNSIYLLRESGTNLWLDKVLLGSNTWTRTKQDISLLNSRGCLIEYDGSPAFLKWSVPGEGSDNLLLKLKGSGSLSSIEWMIIGGSLGAGLVVIFLAFVISVLLRKRTPKVIPKSRQLSFLSFSKNQSTISYASEPTAALQFERDSLPNSIDSTILSVHGPLWGEDDASNSLCDY